MASFNKVILLGNVTRDPELKYISSGTAVTEIGMAINDRRKGPNGDWIEDTTFVDVTLWGRTAEIASEYLNKGAPVLIEGRLKLDTWEKDGKKNSKLRVVGESGCNCLASKGAAEAVVPLAAAVAVPHAAMKTKHNTDNRRRPTWARRTKIFLFEIHLFEAHRTVLSLRSRLWSHGATRTNVSESESNSDGHYQNRQAAAKRLPSRRA